MKKVIIVGTSRKNGNTENLANNIANQLSANIINLNDYQILPYDYEFTNQHDDFPDLIKHLLTFDQLIFASPVYWYSPSSTMKLFLDRLCDLLEINKTGGRKLRGKTAALLSTGYAKEIDTSFEKIFIKTFQYLGMRFSGSLYCSCQDDYITEEHINAVTTFYEQQTRLIYED